MSCLLDAWTSTCSGVPLPEMIETASLTQATTCVLRAKLEKPRRYSFGQRPIPAASCSCAPIDPQVSEPMSVLHVTLTLGSKTSSNSHGLRSNGRSTQWTEYQMHLPPCGHHVPGVQCNVTSTLTGCLGKARRKPAASF